MKRQLEVGDTIKAMGVTATIASITFQEPWSWRNAWYLEFTDTNGVYRNWKQSCDGGKAFDKYGNEIEDMNFSDWLYTKYGIGHDDLTDEDYDNYYSEYESEA